MIKIIFFILIVSLCLHMDLVSALKLTDTNRGRTVRLSRRELPNAVKMTELAQVGVQGLLGVTKHTADGELDMLKPSKPPTAKAAGAPSEEFGVSVDEATNSNSLKQDDAPVIRGGGDTSVVS
jgi:hypothetical protein